MIFSKSTLLALLPFFLATPSLAVSGTGKTTRYWDCCKPSCAWSGKASFKTGPVQSCDKSDNVLADVDTKSACDNGGPAFMCSDESPWAVSDSLAYGFAAVSISGGTEASWCCACYELTFTSGPVSGKKMIVQATNTGGDLGTNHFDIGVRPPFPTPLLEQAPQQTGPYPSPINIPKLTPPRCPAVVSESSTPAPLNTAPPPPAGASNTAASPLAANATTSPCPSRPGVTGDSIGSRTPTTRPSASRASRVRWL
ncbi:hypothetical protein V494_03868 [Pseudogymnoascus sp. VKM F-4513 (FW-928)]|nr:hypothetical protein V494_03868 [Pseudogymnoascus sp. VKM F-4513 (FW-928)]